MAFFFETITTPFWLIIFIVASATPLWIKWISGFHKKFIVTGILQKKFLRVKKSADEIKMDVLKKANDHLDTHGDTSGSSNGKTKRKKSVNKDVDIAKKKNIRAVLAVLADSGEAGVLPKSISDRTKISSIDTTGALTYLIEKKYVEEINSTNGTKYYLTDLGRRYCINKGYISKT